MNVVRPSWIADMGFAEHPPFYGLGDVRLSARPVIGFDTETYAMPVLALKTKGKEKRYMRRKAPRMVCATFAGRGKRTPVPATLQQAELAGKALIFRDGVAWKAIVERDYAIQHVFRDLLLDKETLLVAHNAAYDLGVLAAADRSYLPLIFRVLAEERITDTMVREMLLKIAFGKMQEDDEEGGGGERFDLNTLATSYGLADRSAQKKGADVWRVRYHELDGLPLRQWPSAAVEYALDDAVDALSIAILQAPLGQERRGGSFLPITTPDGGVINEMPQVRAAWALHLMGLWGMRVDPVLYREWGKEIEEKVRFADEIARRAQFLRPDGSVDNKRLQALVEADFAARKKPVPLTTRPKDASPKWAPQTQISKEVLVQCNRLQVEYVWGDGRVEQISALKLWGETAFMRRMQSTYFKPAAMGLDFAMLYDFNVLLATGRTSARNPNMQNPPRDGMYRELFIPRAGKVFASVDYSAEELRTLAQLHYWTFGKSELRDAFLLGEDPHAMFGAKLAGVDYATFKTWKTSPDEKLQKRFKTLRQAAKAANFGYPGGLGAEKFVKYAWDTYFVDLAVVAVQTGWSDMDLATASDEARYELQISYAKHLKQEWLHQWAESKGYMDMIGEEVRYSDTFTYLQPVSWRQRGGCFYTSGNNTGFQGLAADLAKEALWRLAILCYLSPEESVPLLETMRWASPPALSEWAAVLYEVRPVLFVHDEIIAEGPAETAHEWAMALTRLMEASAQIYTPDVPQVAEPALMERWLKGAEPVFVDGRLVPWRPKK